MKSDTKPQSFNLNADGLLRRMALATLLAGASGLAMAQSPGPAPVPATAPESPTGTTTQAADAVSAPSGTTPSSDVPPAASGASVDLEKVTVTGSRIKSLNSTSISPVTTVNAAELKYQGATRVEDLLNSLPQTYAGQGSNVSNGSDGTATVDLRALGPSRTLVLIDGKRVQPGSPLGSSAVDINFIPGQMIERIDVLTGGASAVYGADAVAGVVNFQLRKNFEGVRVDVQRSGYQHNNDDGGVQDIVRSQGYYTPSGSTFGGQGWDASAIMGLNTDDNRGNIVGYVTYRQINQVTESTRDYSACTLAVKDSTHFACGGSGTSAFGDVLSLDNGSRSSVTGNNFRRYVGATDAFNYGPYNYYQRNDERYTFGALGRYKFNDHVESYSQLMFMEDKTDAVIAPSGSFFGGNVYALNIAPAGTAGYNPLLSDQQRAVLSPGTAGNIANVFIGRRNIEGGGRDANFNHFSYRLLTGLRGDLPYDFSYDASVQYGTTTLNEVYRNDFSNTRLQRALNVVNVNGTPTCQSVVDGTDPNCVPYNVFATGGVTPAALAYLQVPLLLNGRTDERVATGSISGIVPGSKLPTANEGLGVSAGLEYREEHLNIQVDNEFATGDGAGQGGATNSASGGYRTKDIFAEARLPVLQRLPFAYDLGLEAGYRHSTFDKFENTNSFKLGLNYSPIEAFKLRGGFNRAVRVPSINEFVTPQSVAIDPAGTKDPCSGTAPVYTQAQCARDPYFAANPNRYGQVLANDAGQYNGLQGSASNISPERADTYTAGFVFSPTRYARGFIGSVDYYSIRVKGFISQQGANNILDGCYQGNVGCNQIHRDAQGLLFTPTGYVVDLTTNTGKLFTQGIDVNAGYRAKLSDLGLGNYGSFNVDYVGNRALRYHVQPVAGFNGFDYDCNGHYGNNCGTPLPNYRHKLRITYVAPIYGITPSFQWRLIGPTSSDLATVAAGAGGGYNELDKHIGTINYFDAYVSAKPVPQFQNLTARIGVNNVFDKRPPLLALGTAGTPLNGNSFSQTYDVLGRYLFAGVQIDFGGRQR